MASRSAPTLRLRGFLSGACAALVVLGPCVFSQLATAADSEQVSYERAQQVTFQKCGRGARINCVVDGDTFWYRGEKIRIIDINTPEIGQPECAREAELGERATERLITLLNQGPFELQTKGRDRDQYGRLLRLIYRDGESLGDVLVNEGLAEVWKGRRSSWCGNNAVKLTVTSAGGSR